MNLFCRKWNQGAILTCFYFFSVYPSAAGFLCVFVTLFLSTKISALDYPWPTPSPCPLPLLSPHSLPRTAPLLLLLKTAVARQQLIEHEGYAIDQLEGFQIKSGVRSSCSYSQGAIHCIQWMGSGLRTHCMYIWVCRSTQWAQRRTYSHTGRMCASVCWTPSCRIVWLTFDIKQKLKREEALDSPCDRVK